MGAAILVAGGVAARHASSARTLHYLYVVSGNEAYVYDIDQHHRLVQTIQLPLAGNSTHGLAAAPASGMLYVAYGGEGGGGGTGSLLAYDLLTSAVVWHQDYSTGIDSMAITPDGRTIYMPVGEGSGDGTWEVIDTSNGNVIGSIAAGAAAHDTCMGSDGKFVYLGGVDHPYLEVASTSTNKIVRQIGPLHGPGVRPFVINSSQTLAFTTATSFLGFQVSSIKTGKVIYSVAPPGFTFDANTFGRTPNHGISLSPDGRELYLIDTPNGYVHVFDVSRLPTAPPRDIADIKLAHPPPNSGWLEHSADGRYVYVGNAGDVIDTRSHKIVAFLPTMQQSPDYLEIDWRNGRPVAATTRCG